jgi:hypothetical protein
MSDDFSDGDAAGWRTTRGTWAVVEDEGPVLTVSCPRP